MIRLLALALFLAACATPDRAFWGAAPQRVSVDGRDYDVYVRRGAAAGGICLAGVAMATCRADRQDAVQVIRLGYAQRAEHGAILQAMRQAAVQASGCALIDGTAQGDSGVMTARLRCPG